MMVSLLVVRWNDRRLGQAAAGAATAVAAERRLDRPQCV